MPSRSNCCVKGCGNSKKMAELSFFALPLEYEKRKEWLHLVGRGDLADRANIIKTKSYQICCRHFENSMMSMYIKRKLLPEALPSKRLTAETQRLPEFSNARVQTEEPYTHTIYVVQYSQAEKADAETQTDKCEIRRKEKRVHPEAVTKTPRKKLSLLDFDEKRKRKDINTYHVMKLKLK